MIAKQQTAHNFLPKFSSRDLLHDALLYWPDVRRNEQYWSPDFKTLLGYMPSQINASYTNFRGLLHPDDLGNVAHAISQHINGTVALRTDLRLKTRSGEYRWFKSIGTSNKNSRGNIMNMTTFLQDIHDRKTDEKALAKFHAITSDLRLLHTHKLKKILLHSLRYLGMSMGVVIRVSATDGESDVLGMVGRHDDYQQREQYILSLAEKLARSKMGIVTHSNLQQHDPTFECSPGAVMAAPIYSGESCAAVLVFFGDEPRKMHFRQMEKDYMSTVCQWFACDLARNKYVLQLENREKKLVTKVDRLSRSNKELEAFANVLAHDLQAPLGLVAGFSNLLISDCADDLDERAKEYLHYVNDGVSRMVSMIQDLQQYSLCDPCHSEKETVDFNNLVLEIESLFIAENPGLVLSSGDLPTISGVYARYFRVVHNLISNAIKHRDKSLAPQIHISAKEEKKNWCFCIEDNGVGVAEADLKIIFQPFERLCPSDENTGMGIGLSICQKLVESWGGRIWVKSTLGQGSRFCFTIPKPASRRVK